MLAAPVSLTVLNDGSTRVVYQAQNAAGEAVAYPATGQTLVVDPPIATVSVVNLSGSMAGPLAIDIVPNPGALGAATVTMTDDGGLPCSPLHLTFASDTVAAQFVFLVATAVFTPF